MNDDGADISGSPRPRADAAGQRPTSTTAKPTRRVAATSNGAPAEPASGRAESPTRPSSATRNSDGGPATTELPAQQRPRPATRRPAAARNEIPPSPPRSSLLDAIPDVEPAVPAGPLVLPDIVPGDPSDAVHRPVVRTGPVRPRVRRVTRVVRHVDTWSVFKVALVFHIFLYIVFLTSGVLLWKVADNTGTLDNVERFFESFGWQTFELDGGQIFHNAWVAGLFVVIGLTGLALLVATLFNLITDLVGGIRVSVLEEEVVSTDDRRRAGAVNDILDRLRDRFS